MLQRRQRSITVLCGRAPAQSNPVIAAHEHDVRHLERKAVIHGIALRDVPEPKSRSNRHGSAKRLQRAQNGSQNGRLARAVRADEAKKIARRDVEREIGKYHATPVAERRAVESNESTGLAHFTAFAS